MGWISTPGLDGMDRAQWCSTVHTPFCVSLCSIPSIKILGQYIELSEWGKFNTTNDHKVSFGIEPNAVNSLDQFSRNLIGLFQVWVL